LSKASSILTYRRSSGIATQLIQNQEGNGC
jgi:hypothetical protein